MIEWIKSNWATALPIILSISSFVYTSVIWKRQKKLEAGLARSKAAYDIILRKEFDYYEKVDPIYAKLVPDIHDIVNSLSDSYPVSMSQENRQKIARENLLYYLESMATLKSHYVSFDIYLPNKVCLACSEAIQIMQENADFLSDMLKILNDDKESQIDKDKCKQVADTILFSYAYARGSIKNRLVELAKI